MCIRDRYKSKEFVSTSSDSDTSESSGSSRCGARSPQRHSGKADRGPSRQPSRSPSPAPTTPKIRKVRFEIDQPLVESGESSRARKQPVKATPSTSVATGPGKKVEEVNLPSSTSKRTTKARQPRKPAITAQSEVHTASQPPGTQKKGTKSSAVTAPPAITPQKRWSLRPHAWNIWLTLLRKQFRT